MGGAGDRLLRRGVGLPTITGRIVGWLMICDPAEHRAERIKAAHDSLTWLQNLAARHPLRR